MGNPRKIPVSASPQACVYCALLLLAIPLQWLLAWLIAAAVHELFHCIALLLCGNCIHSFQIGFCGAKIESSPLTPLQHIVCALAGPAGGLLLLIISKYCPTVTLCALVQSTVNLLPVIPLDGGQALYGFICMFVTPNTANRICSVVSWSVLGVVFVAGITASFAWGFWQLLLFPVYLMLHLIRNKNSLQIIESRSTIVLPK